MNSTPERPGNTADKAAASLPDLARGRPRAEDRPRPGAAAAAPRPSWQGPGSPGGPDARGAHRGGQGAGPAGLPRQAALRALLRALHHRSRGPHGPPQGRPRRARRTILPAAAHRGLTAVRRPRGHPEVPVEAVRRIDGRVRADALQRPRHPVHLLRGRLRHELPLLRHRPDGPDPQPLRRGDSRAGAHRQQDARPRRAPRWHRPRLEHRVHGHGGAVGELPARGHRVPAPERPGPGGLRRGCPPHHRLHRRSRLPRCAS